MAGACWQRRVRFDSPAKLAAVLRRATEARGDRRMLLGSRGCFGAAQKQVWCAEARVRIFGCSTVELGLLRRSVALQATVGASLDWWRLGEGEEGAGPEWYGLWSEVEVLEVSDQNGCRGVCGEM